MKNRFRIVFTLLFFHPSYSQDISIDSLKRLLNTAKNDTTLGILEMQLAEYSLNDSAFKVHNQRALTIAEKNIPTAKGAELISFLKIKASAYNNIGYDETTLGNLSKALEYYQECLKIEQEIKNDADIAFVLNNIADVYETQGNISAALKYYDESLKMHEKNKNIKGIAQAYNNIGFIYSTQDDLEKALDYYQKSYKIKKQLNDKSGMAVTLGNIGYIYMQQKADYKAMSYYLLALKTATEIQEKNRMGLLYSDIGGIYENQKNYGAALSHYFKGLELSTEAGDVDAISHHMYNLGKAYQKKNKIDSALYWGNQSMKHAQDVGSPNSIRMAAQLLKNTYAAQGNTAKALEYFELYFKMNDSINNEETKKATFKQQLSYEYDKKETLAKAEQEKRDLENADAIKRQRIITVAIGIGLLIVLIFSIFLYKRFVLTQKQKKIIEEQKAIVDEKNTEILDSITYAKRLQEAILPPLKTVTEHFSQSFILYKPKDIVAGDFYWLEHKNNLTFFAAADCTGHGVPGAMVSVVCSNALNRAVKEFGITDPGKILDKVRELVVETFQKSESEVKDGMDISLCSYNKESKELKWAGANNPLWMIKNNELIEYKANKQPIGKVDHPTPFTTHTIEATANDSIFLFTDGYADQFGGPKGKKFKYSSFKDVLLKIQKLPTKEQAYQLNKIIEDWKGTLEQVDDILVIGITL